MADKKTRAVIEEADELLRCARDACRRLGLDGRGSDCSLPHELRMFARHFTRESRDGPGELQVNGDGRCDAVLKKLGELQ